MKNYVNAHISVNDASACEIEIHEIMGERQVRVSITDVPGASLWFLASEVPAFVQKLCAVADVDLNSLLGNISQDSQ